MSSLNHRAEQALIGALLARPTEPLDRIQAKDFAHPGHAAIYTAIHDTRLAQPDLAGDALIRAVAARAGTPGIGEAQLRQLRDDCPRPGHVAAYARMVEVAAFRRQIITYADTYTRAAATGDADPALQRLADALTRQATLHTAMDHTLDTQSRTASPEPDLVRQGMEDDVLAVAIQYPEQAIALSRAIPAETFTSQQRRDIFETTISLAASGDPVDAVIVAWELERTQYIQQLTTGNPADPAAYPEPTTTYLARLAERPITIHTAIHTGRQLVAQDLTTKLQNRTATTQQDPRPTRPAQVVTTPFNPALTPQPGPQPGNTPRLNGSGGA